MNHRKRLANLSRRSIPRAEGNHRDQGRDTLVRISPIADPDPDQEEVIGEEHGERGMDAHTSPKIQTPLLRHIAPDIISMKPDVRIIYAFTISLYGNVVYTSVYKV